MPSTESLGAKAIRVVVADDTRIHTQLLADALRRDPELEVISSPSHFRDLIEMVKMHVVDILVLSSTLDEKQLHGCDALRELRAKNPLIRAVMLLESSRREAVLQAFRAGARGILSRHESVETLSKCIRSVHQGQIWANSQQMSFAVEALASFPTVCAIDANGLELLSKREMEVVQSLAEGLTNREIAERLGLSQHTIKNYLFRVFDKLGVSSRLELLFMTLTQAGTRKAGSPSEFVHDVSGNGHDAPRRPAPASRRIRAKAVGSMEDTPVRRVGGLDVRMRYLSSEDQEQPSLTRKNQGSEGRDKLATAIGADDRSRTEPGRI